jgi:RNA polymerase sigma factor (sigma-70 family)
MLKMKHDVRCVDAAKRGDPRCREVLVGAYLPIVKGIASRYCRMGIPFDDLVQEGSIGLMEAIVRYEPARSEDFEAYARFQIRRAIRNALTDQSRLIRLPKHVIERRRAVERVDAAVQAATGRIPTPAEIATVTGLDAATVIAVRTVGGPLLSLDQPLSEDGASLETTIADDLAHDPESATVRHDEEAAVDSAVADLPQKQRVVVERHFGLGCPAEQIGEVAAELHVSQQRVRAIERDALYALRDRLDPKVTPRRAR